MLLIVLGLFVGQGLAQEAERQRFVDAEAALRSNDRAAYGRLESALVDYPLYPYLLRADLISRLGSASDGEIGAFLRRYDGEPFTPALRGAWLRHLAGSGRWSTLLEYYRPGFGISVDCRQAEALYRTGQRQAAFERIPELWVYGRSRPDACDPVFDLWVRSGGVTPDLAWQRIGLALENGQSGLARYLRRFVPEGERRFVDEWIAVQKNPRSVLTAAAVSRANPYAGEIVLQALRSWSRHDSPGAAEALDRLRGRYELPQEGLAALEIRLALFLASRGHPDAERRLAAVPVELETRPVREWRVRTAMRGGRWAQVVELVDAMPAEERESLQWRYWKARAHEELGEYTVARSIFTELAGARDYHGFLAADRLGADYNLVHSPIHADPALESAESGAPALRRARELFLLGRLEDARREWWHHFEDAGRERWLAAARIAADWGWSSEGIAAAARAREWDDLEIRFPLDYRQQILRQARAEDIEPEWVYAILRQESIFRTDARSSAGALGLMQLLPSTARLVADDLQVSYRGTSQLLEADSNILLGARYLRMSRDDLDGRALLATAGYNAGPHRVLEWLPEDNALPADLWIELVPFGETRKYLRRVLEYSVIYQHRLDLEPGFLERQMAPVPSRASLGSS